MQKRLFCSFYLSITYSFESEISNDRIWKHLKIGGRSEHFIKSFSVIQQNVLFKGGLVECVLFHNDFF